MSAPAPPYLADVIPGLRGRGVVLADPADFADIALTLLGAGYTVCEIDGGELTTRRLVLPALADALHLPGAADRNLDALMDTLRDLPDRWPRADRLVLLWRAAEQFIEGEPQVWEEVADILRQASRELRGAAFAFETVAFVDGYDVPPLLLGVPHHPGSVP
ncbi:MAG: barstar family protein [Actinobacteria bacterium]|nr:barstar family protein [Actinomycetota bacterium]